MYENVKEEDMLNYYLHRFIMSNISYADYRNQVLQNINREEKTEEEILKDVKEIIDTFNERR